MIKNILFIFLVFVSFNVHASTDSDIKAYKEAEKAYYDKDYQKAEKLFQRLLGESDNGYLYYNLGNVYFNLGQKGRALQYYEKARLVLPRFSDLKTNLNLLSEEKVDDAGESFTTYLLKTFYFWQEIITVSEYGLFLFVFTLIFWAFLFLKLLRRQKIITTIPIIIIFIFCYLSYGYYLKSDQDSYDKNAVVISKIVPVRPSYLENEDILFELHEGTLVEVIDEQAFKAAKWLRIELPQGQRGWVKSTDLGMI